MCDISRHVETVHARLIAARTLAIIRITCGVVSVIEVPRLRVAARDVVESIIRERLFIRLSGFRCAESIIRKRLFVRLPGSCTEFVAFYSSGKIIIIRLCKIRFVVICGLFDRVIVVVSIRRILNFINRRLRQISRRDEAACRSSKLH